MTEGNKNTAQRIVNAEQDFTEILMFLGGCSVDDARIGMAYYLKKKIAKLDPVSGTVRVAHGAFLDKGAILEAVSLAKKENA